MRVAYGSSSETRAAGPATLANYTGTEAVNPSAMAPNASSSFPLVELHLSARRLKDMDIITVSDPICVLFTPAGNGRAGEWSEFARTEVVWNNLNPEWVTYFTVMYVFEVRQPLMLRVYDVDNANANLSAHDFIGEAHVELSQIVSRPEPTELELKHPRQRGFRGTLVVAHEQVENCSSLVSAQIACQRLRRARLLFANDPFFVVAKASEGGRFLPVYQSEVNRRMAWKPFQISFQALCNTEADRPIRITFFDYRSHTAAVPIGHHDTTFTLMSEGLGKILKIVDARGAEQGVFVFAELSMVQKFNFYDYLRGGIQLNLFVAIDFTTSNRPPHDPASLHYMAPNGDSMNQYEKCIHAVCEILCPYDSDQLFPVLGFGARVRGAISHCFPLTFNPEAPNVHGLDGIMQVYRHALSQVELAGPTLFSHVIRFASRNAVESFRESRTYTILLILTDGIINDMQDTIDAIVDAGRLPLSIIIVGIGNADFGPMEVLDADDEPLVARTGYTMCRDLVQFVPFNKFANKHYSILAQEVLDEIPRQLCEWAEMNGVYPQ
jgi:vacuolar-type H+-ATPase subunit F/Vma7